LVRALDHAGDRPAAGRAAEHGRDIAWPYRASSIHSVPAPQVCERGNAEECCSGTYVLNIARSE
jgi:hypothetical protein